jgi:hypothetical protein
MLYVRSRSDTNPSLTYTAPGIESGTRTRVIQTNDQSYITFNGITVRDGNGIHDNQVNVGTVSVTGIVFENSTIERASSNGIELKGSTTAHDVTIDHCTIQNNGEWGILSDYTYASATISNSTISGNGWRSVMDNQEYDGIEGQLGGFQIYGNAIYANAPVCSGTGMCHGIYADPSATPFVIHDNVIYGQTNGDGVKTQASGTLYNNTIYGNYYEGIQVAGNGSTSIAVVIHHNIIYGNNVSNRSSGVTEQSKGSGSLTLTVENNTFYQNGNTTQQEFKVADNLTSLTVLNNIFFASPTRRTIDLVTQSGPFSFDYNLDWRADGNILMTLDGTGQTWSAWKAHGFDAHSPAPANPLFQNPPANFMLAPNSPAVGAGIYISGLSASNPPNIGAN